MHFEGKLNELNKALNEKKWINTDLHAVKKNGRLIRFLKSLLQIFCIDPFEKIRLDKVANAFEKYCQKKGNLTASQVKSAQDFLGRIQKLSNKEKYIQTIHSISLNILKQSAPSTVKTDEAEPNSTDFPPPKVRSEEKAEPATMKTNESQLPKAEPTHTFDKQSFLEKHLGENLKPLTYGSNLSIELLVSEGFEKAFEKLKKMNLSPFDNPLDLLKAFFNQTTANLMDLAKYPLSHYLDGWGVGRDIAVQVLEEDEQVKKIITETLLYNLYARREELLTIVPKDKKIEVLYKVKDFDLFFRWEISPIRFFVMKDEEIENLTLAELPNDVTVFLHSDLWISIYKKTNGWTKAIDAKKPSEITPSEVFFMSPEKVALFPTFTEEQLRVLFSNPELCSQLSANQILSVADKMTQRQSKKLSMEQVLSIPLSKITSSLFDLLYRAKGVEKFDIQHLSQLEKFFNSTDWQKLSKEQRGGYPIEQIDETTFHLLYPKPGSWDTGGHALKERSIDEILKLQNYFTDSHWILLSEDQILAYPIEQMDQNKFKFCSKYGSSNFIKKKSIDEILELEKFFSPSHWYSLSDEQRLQYPVEKIDKEKFEKLFPGSGWKAKELFKQMDNEKIVKLSPFFKFDHWRALTHEQKNEFPAELITEEAFESLYFLDDEHKLLAKRPLADLEKLKAYFKEKHIKTLTPEQRDHLGFK